MKKPLLFFACLITLLITLATLNIYANSFDISHNEVKDFCNVKKTKENYTSIPVLTIYEIQYTTEVSGNSPYNNQIVSTSGTVTEVSANSGYYIQDDSKPWHGIFIYDKTHVPSIGDNISVTGKVYEYYNMTELTNISAYIVNSSGNLTEPIEVACKDAKTEQYEGLLIYIKDSKCISEVEYYGSFGINDGTGIINVHNINKSYKPTVGNFYKITGVVSFSYGEFKIIPRKNSDIEEYILNNEAEIISFSLAEEAGPAMINSETATIEERVYAGVDLTNLIPTITISQYAKIYPSSDIAQDFSRQVTYTVTAQNGTVKKWFVNVTKPNTENNETTVEKNPAILKFKNGMEINVDIVSMTQDIIIYKKDNDPTGEIYRVSAKNVEVISENSSSNNPINNTTTPSVQTQEVKETKTNVNETPVTMQPMTEEKMAVLKKALNRADAAKDAAKLSNSKDDWADVISEYKSALKIDSTYSLIYYELGYASEVIEEYNNAIKYYNKFLKIDPYSNIAEAVQTNIDKLEFKRDKNKKQELQLANINGLWKSDVVNNYTKTPLWIFKFDQFDNDIRVTVMPKSFLYNQDFTYPTAIAQKDGKYLRFWFSTDRSISPQEDMNNASSVLSGLSTVESLVSPLANSYFGAAASVIGMIPAGKNKELSSTFVFKMDISNPNRFSGKCNVKQYVAVQGSKPKTTTDEIADFNFTKMRQNEYDLVKKKYDKKIKPGVSLLLSIICPGGGYFYNKQYTKGAIFLGSGLGLFLYAAATPDPNSGNGFMNVSSAGATCLTIALLMDIYSVINSPISANKINKKFGLALLNDSEKKNFFLKVKPQINYFAYNGKVMHSTGLGLSLNFK